MSARIPRIGKGGECVLLPKKSAASLSSVLITPTLVGEQKTFGLSCFLGPPTRNQAACTTGKIVNRRCGSYLAGRLFIICGLPFGSGHRMFRPLQEIFCACFVRHPFDSFPKSETTARMVTGTGSIPTATAGYAIWGTVKCRLRCTTRRGCRK